MTSQHCTIYFHDDAFWLPDTLPHLAGLKLCVIIWFISIGAYRVVWVPGQDLATGCIWCTIAESVLVTTLYPIHTYMLYTGDHMSLRPILVIWVCTMWVSALHYLSKKGMTLVEKIARGVNVSIFIIILQLCCPWFVALCTGGIHVVSGKKLVHHTSLYVLIYLIKLIKTLHDFLI